MKSPKGSHGNVGEPFVLEIVPAKSSFEGISLRALLLIKVAAFDFGSVVSGFGDNKNRPESPLKVLIEGAVQTSTN